jgi:hypothetical protein
MTRQLYELNHPLYPNQELLKYYNDHKIEYRPHQGSYDAAYNNWYQLVRADHDISGAPKRNIYREISQIIRLRSSGKEFLLYSEYLYGQDHENNMIPFFHTYGQYIKPNFKTVYNYDTKTASTLPTGQNDTIFFIEYSPETIEKLYEAGPDDSDIELLVSIGSRQYGGRGFFKYDEFRDFGLEELARIGREGKGMFTTLQSNIPTSTAQAELKAISGGAAAGNNQSVANQQQLWKEFQEFQKFKQSQQQLTGGSVKPIDESTSRIKIKATGEK